MAILEPLISSANSLQLVKLIRIKLLNKIDSNVAYTDHSNAIHSVLFVPDYLNPIIDRDVYKIKSVEQFFKGYTIDLRSFKTADAYIKDKFRSNAKGIRRKIRRLTFTNNGR